jgi:RNA polymerase sigma-54 factor
MTELGFGMKQRGALAMTPALRQAIGFLALSNADLSARLADLQAAVAVIVSAKTVPGAWPALVRHVDPPPGDSARPHRREHPAPGGLDTDRIAEAAPGLVAHVEAQLPLLVRAAADRPVAEAFLRAVEPSGWLGASLDEVAAEAGCSLVRAEAVLRKLQAAEPAGLFARSLAECLALQAEDRGLASPAFSLLLRNLPLLAAGRMDALEEACGCGAAEMAAMVRALRQMNPKPGAAFEQGAQPIPRPPDLVLRRDGAGWLLELNAETTPLLRLSAGAEAAPEALRQARALTQALERRHATVLSIAAELVARQDAHLRDAATPPAAVTINEVAASVGVHRSTVSRVTAALTMALPRRTISLRALISAPAPAARRTEDPPSVQAVLQRMQAIVAAEDPLRPLADAEIARLLLADGAALARRTVVKYRGLAGIPPRGERRRA